MWPHAGQRTRVFQLRTGAGQRGKGSERGQRTRRAATRIGSESQPGQDRAVELLERAVEILAGSPAQLESVRALVALGAALRPADPLGRALVFQELNLTTRTELYRRAGQVPA